MQEPELEDISGTFLGPQDSMDLLTTVRQRTAPWVNDKPPRSTSVNSGSTRDTSDYDADSHEDTDSPNGVPIRVKQHQKTTQSLTSVASRRSILKGKCGPIARIAVNAMNCDY